MRFTSLLAAAGFGAVVAACAGAPDDGPHSSGGSETGGAGGVGSGGSAPGSGGTTSTGAPDGPTRAVAIGAPFPLFDFWPQGGAEVSPLGEDAFLVTFGPLDGAPAFKVSRDGAVESVWDNSFSNGAPRFVPTPSGGGILFWSRLDTINTFHGRVMDSSGALGDEFVLSQTFDYATSLFDAAFDGSLVHVAWGYQDSEFSNVRLGITTLSPEGMEVASHIIDLSEPLWGNHVTCDSGTCVLSDAMGVLRIWTASLEPQKILLDSEPFSYGDWGLEFLDGQLKGITGVGDPNCGTSSEGCVSSVSEFRWDGQTTVTEEPLFDIDTVAPSEGNFGFQIAERGGRLVGWKHQYYDGSWYRIETRVRSHPNAGSIGLPDELLDIGVSRAGRFLVVTLHRETPEATPSVTGQLVDLEPL